MYLLDYRPSSEDFETRGKRMKQLNSRYIVNIFLVFTLAMVTGISNVVRAKETETSPVGLWKTVDDDTGKAKSIVEIWEKNGVLYGRIKKLIDPSEPNPVCDKCTGKRQNSPIIGMTIMEGLKQDGKEWNGGTILDPENGKTYKVLIEVQNGGKKLKVRGYIGFSLLGRTQYWLSVQ
jgi:uncharacterized protein (DUF2147 family)